jgi:hypothetical protein
MKSVNNLRACVNRVKSHTQIRLAEFIRIAVKWTKISSRPGSAATFPA